MNTVVDAGARAAAIDPLRSFCVAAPAGSGKTELLIQRYLALLARVRRPEQVLAITFTRKAAAEMRDRVMGALEAAQAGKPVQGAHEEVTRELASRALTMGREMGWFHPGDLSGFNIKTIDSFCAGLSRQLPVLSGLGGRASGQDDASELYAEAVGELFGHLDGDGPAAPDLKAIMRHFDNNWERLQDLLVAMLARRDQWQGYIDISRDPAAAEAYLVDAVAAVLRAELEQLSSLLSSHQAELLQLLCYSAKNLERDEPSVFPGTNPEAIEEWRELRKMLLTGPGKWRKSIDTRGGFPAGGEEEKRWKARWNAQLEQLQAIDGLEGRLAAVSILPTMATGSTSWALVVHLSRLLPLLAAELLLVFQRHGVVDHTQVSQSALLALGEDDAVTDLALRLDYNIEHILVDEFQDTAITQYDLLQKLTRGWREHNEANPQAPRTLIIVGDPMQSIYGFRGANVGLFLLAREEGFNGVRPEYLQLECNFRSDRGLVEWVNEVFVDAFPDTDNAHLSQVRYSPATPVRDAGLVQAVDAHAFQGDGAADAEMRFLCDYIERHAEAETVAVLGRSRGHLQPLIDELKVRGIAHNAQDLDSLADSTVVADLLVLCRALTSDADRLSWLSLLRAPWCALSLDDLLLVSQFGEFSGYTPVRQAIFDQSCRAQLSEDGRLRLESILPVLARARDKRDRLGLRVFVEQAWTGLGGPQCVTSDTGLQDAEQFMQLLEEADALGVGLDVDWLQSRLESQFMSGGDPEAPVQLMTLHKAKGLEFPRVIIPQLGRPPRSGEREILRWQEHADAGGERQFLLAADDGSQPGEPSLYNYLGHMQGEKQLLENTRLLYVGATRAEHHLLLTATLKWKEGAEKPTEPSSRSLLAAIWTSFSRQMTLHAAEPEGVEHLRVSGGRLLARLARSSSARPVIDTSAAVVPQVPPAALAQGVEDNHRERSIGTVVHLALEVLSHRSPLPDELSEADATLLRTTLQQLGLFGEEAEQALSAVRGSVAATLASPGGRWVLSQKHPDAHSEWPLSTVDDEGKVRDIIIDRALVDARANVRWIVDYKNSQPLEGESLEAFLARESEKYAAQLGGYRAALNAIENRDIHCALFFTALGVFHPLDGVQLPSFEDDW